MPRYKQQFKADIQKRLMSSKKEPLEAVSMETGVAVHTLENWRAQAMATDALSHGWTPERMLDGVVGAMRISDETARNAWLVSQNIGPLDFMLWGNAALEGLRAFGRVTRGESKATRLRIRVLERDLRKKDETMASAAALVLDGYGEIDAS
ncbi:hypothetical protein M3A49_41290 [Paraburkholderia sp. CNPSo 3076]|uniref:hypothetical protein n=1 Tax=Paraburkholderia sp. CNPSo 3076 TaxID=2940936 RepID=UPI002250DDCA|nr:hypothetical protein [Paraburkholderia sp. CNPSo 3076]MCX5545769.1 hypothetical protein [Paraburkholderia sp. CNPSo 3076]